MWPIDSYGVRVIEFAAILFEFDYYLNFTFWQANNEVLDKQGNWKLKLCSHSFWIAKSWSIWLRSVVIRSRLFPRGNFWFVCCIVWYLSFFMANCKLSVIALPFTKRKLIRSKQLTDVHCTCTILWPQFSAGKFSLTWWHFWIRQYDILL